MLWVAVIAANVVGIDIVASFVVGQQRQWHARLQSGVEVTGEEKGERRRPAAGFQCPYHKPHTGTLTAQRAHHKQVRRHGTDLWVWQNVEVAVVGFVTDNRRDLNTREKR